MFFVMYGRMIFSSVFAIGERSEMGLYEAPWLWSLFGFGIGMMLASFQARGMMFVLSASLYMLVKYVTALGPRCFRCCMFMLSGPSERLVFAPLIACFVCCVVMVICSVLSFLVVSSIFLCLLLVVCLTVLMNCLLKAFAMSLFVVSVLWLNVIALLFVVSCFLLLSWLIVCQRMWVFVLWSQFCPSFSRQMFVLCSCISLLMLLLRSGILGSFGLFFRMLSLSVTIRLMCSGSIVFWCLLFPFGMNFVSACRMMFVIVLFASWTLVGCPVLVMASSMY